MGTAAGTKLGRYEIVKHLASGGMAEVLLARATGIEGFARHVVLKRIRDAQAKDPSFVQMFLQEARLAAQLHHHNIVQVHDIGQEGGEYFFAMEYVHGEDLRHLLTKVARERSRVPLEHIVQIIASAAVALHHAHEQRGPDRKPLGLVHRDVTPANILVGYDGNVKVVDFGIAKAVAQTSETQAGQLKGKASYMAPEQCTGEAVDRRSDVFALGIVLYELACTRRLFKADNDFLTMSAIVKGHIPPPTKHRPDLPKALEAIMLKALAAKREDRYQTADEMREALEQFAASAGLRTSTSGLAAYMKQVFGERPEPWLLDEDEDEISLTIDFDGSASGVAAPPSESVEALAIPQTVEPGKSSPIMKARKKAITDAPPAKTLMATVPTVVAAGKAVRAPVAVPKEPAGPTSATGAAGATDPVRIPEKSFAPEPSKPVLKPVVAAPAPRRKPITIQIPTQSGSVPTRTATPVRGAPIVAPAAVSAPATAAAATTAAAPANVVAPSAPATAAAPTATAAAPTATAAAPTAPRTEIDAGWGTAPPPIGDPTPASSAVPAAATAPVAAAPRAASAPPAAAIPRASSAPGLAPSTSSTPSGGIPSLTRRATPPGAFLAKSGDTPPGAFLAKSPPERPTPDPTRSKSSPIASVLSAASMTPKAPDAERTSASAVLAELAATADDDSGPIAAPPIAAPPASGADEPHTRADSEPVAVHAPLRPDAGDTPGPSPVVRLPSEPAPLPLPLPPPPVPSGPRPGEVPVVPFAAIGPDAEATELSASAFDSAAHRMALEEDAAGAAGAFARGSRMSPGLEARSREPSGVPAEWPDASSAVGQTLPRRLVERAKAMPKRIAAGVAGVVIAVVAIMHCGGSKPATVAKPATAPAAEPAHADPASADPAAGSSAPTGDTTQTPAPGTDTPTGVETAPTATTAPTTVTTHAPAATHATHASAATATGTATRGPAVKTAPTTKGAAAITTKSAPSTTSTTTKTPATKTTTTTTKTTPSITTKSAPITTTKSTTTTTTTKSATTKSPTTTTTTPTTKAPAKPTKPTKPAPKWDPNALFPKK